MHVEVAVAMRFEVEKKFRASDHDTVSRRLKELGAAPGEAVEQEDLYLSHPSRDFTRTSEAFRIRRVGSHNAFTYKGPKLAGPTKTRHELEVAFESGAHGLETMRAMLKMLGFRPIHSVKKTRTPYHLESHGRALEIALDDVEGLGTFVEVEAIAQGEEDLPAAQRAVTEIAASLGLTDDEPRSYLRMAMEQIAGR